MQSKAAELLESRIADIVQGLHQSNGYYALAAERRKHLYENIDHIISSEEDVTISAGDCLFFQAILEQDSIMTTVIQQELYRQGYRDGIKYLALLGALS